MNRYWVSLGALSAALSAEAAGPLSPVREWDPERAAHLLRRAGFGGTPEQIDQLVPMGAQAAVDALVDYEKTPQIDAAFVPAQGLDRGDMRERMMDLGDEERKEIRRRLIPLHRFQMESMRAWWMRRMTVTPRPLEEKMTLFWHGHFTSGAREVENATLMWQQNALLREHALGEFRELLVGISQDGAMLRYLDNISNKKKEPNENYARELMELFTLGEGHYTEEDVKEAARAFTGWTLGPDGFRVVQRQHDHGEKRFLGKRGRFDGQDIIDIILEQKAAGDFLARKLLRFFVVEDPPEAWVRALAYELRRNHFDLRETLRTLLQSEMFYNQEAMFALVKSPVELVVGSLRLMEAPPDDAYWMSDACRDMGQHLFQPPNVKGWDGGRQWINTATLFERYNFARGLLAGSDQRELRRRQRQLERLDTGLAEIKDHMEDYPGLELPPGQVELKAQQPASFVLLARRHGLLSADEVADHFIQRLLQRRLTPEQREILLEVLGDDFRLEQAVERVREMVNVLMAMPEYQLN